MSSQVLFANSRINILVIINVTILTYFILLTGGYSCLDDVELIHNLQKGNFTIQSIFESGGRVYYRPLIMLSYYVNYWLLATNPAAFHATNILLHTINAVLLYAVCLVYLKERQWGKYGALFGALLFAVTPLNSEAVSWISARTDLLCCTFFLLALWVAITEVILTLPASLLFGVAFLLSLCTKEASAPLLAIVPLYLFSRKAKDIGWSRTISFSAVAVLVGCIYTVLRMGGMTRFDNGVSKVVATASQKAVSQVIYESVGSAGFYLKKLLWPFPLNFSINSINMNLYVPLGILALVLMLTLYIRIKDTRLPILIVTCCLVPPLLALHGSIPWTSYAERYLYLPMTGAAMLAGLAVAKIGPRLNVVVPFCLVLVLAIATNSRAALWTDQVMLWRDTVEKSQFPASRVNYAYELIQEDRLDAAKDNLQQAQDSGYESEFFWKCRAMIAVKQRDIAGLEQAILKATKRSPNPEVLRTEFQKHLRKSSFNETAL